jgi:hypothetical protein
LLDFAICRWQLRQRSPELFYEYSQSDMNSKMPSRLLRRGLVLFLMVVLAYSSFAGSIYSRHGIGLLRYRDAVRSVGMGGIGLAITDSVYAYFLNPATMTRLNFTRIQGDILYERASINLRDGSGLLQDANVNSFSFAIPVKRGYVLAFGVQPYSRSEFEFNRSKNDSVDSYEEVFRGTGGINEFFLAFAATLGPVHAGLTSDFYFGRINRVWRVNFTSQDLRNTEDVVNNHVTGIGLHLGAQTQLGKLMLGAAAGLPSRLSVGTELTTVTGFTSDTSESKVKLPLWWGVGVAYAPNRHWLLGADWRTQRWSTVKPEELFGERGADSFDLGFGVEITPSFDPLNGYFKRVSYRVGGAFRQLPYEEPAGKKIQEWTATLGFGLPFTGGYNRIDLSLEVGKRGSLSSNVAEENIVMIRAAIVGSERWFQRGSRK